MKLSHSVQRTIIVALLSVLSGGVLLLIGASVSKPWLSVLLLNVGAFIIASVAMALIFEFWQLRSLLDDLFAAAQVSEQLQRAQLSGFSVSFYDGVPWDELFNESNRLDLMVSYARSWRNTQLMRLQRFLEREDAILEVVLPDPEVELTVNELATRFGTDGEQVRRDIREAFDFFVTLAEGARGVVKIYYLARSPTFTFYRFNNRVVFATYRHQPGRGPILTLVAKRGGEFYDWVRTEWYGITKEGIKAGMTRLVYPSTDADAALRETDVN